MENKNIEELTEKLNEVFGVLDEDYLYGAAEVYADCVTLDDLNDADLLERDRALYEEAPTFGEFVDFINKWEDKDISLVLRVIDPKREDFRIEVLALTITHECAKLDTDEDMLFWKEFVDFKKKGCPRMLEDDEVIQLAWF